MKVPPTYPRGRPAGKKQNVVTRGGSLGTLGTEEVNLCIFMQKSFIDLGNAQLYVIANV